LPAAFLYAGLAHEPWGSLKLIMLILPGGMVRNILI